MEARAYMHAKHANDQRTSPTDPMSPLQEQALAIQFELREEARAPRV